MWILTIRGTFTTLRGIFQSFKNFKKFQKFKIFTSHIAAWSYGGWNGGEGVGTFWSCSIFLQGKPENSFRNVQIFKKWLDVDVGQLLYKAVNMGL